MNDVSGQALQILFGFRPPVSETDPRFYTELMEKCWCVNSKDRPTAEELCERFKSWMDDETKIKRLNEYLEKYIM
ncbi:4477_t:CDS:2 [Cetraspora pellucida]|uniref:4477_t:CDS:1 n=1 Tax=Cetraspora pellucida TaxID=1433469 RepID=A0A9N8ZAV5_9GLOM|nr:4477_t:CDS:2 [Cetraspora pellucida]